jgi:hypothetical protein
MGWMSRRALVQEGPKDRSADGEFFQEMTERLEPLLSSQQQSFSLIKAGTKRDYSVLLLTLALEEN